MKFLNAFLLKWPLFVAQCSCAHKSIKHGCRLLGSVPARACLFCKFIIPSIQNTRQTNMCSLIIIFEKNKTPSNTTVLLKAFESVTNLFKDIISCHICKLIVVACKKSSFCQFREYFRNKLQPNFKSLNIQNSSIPGIYILTITICNIYDTNM